MQGGHPAAGSKATLPNLRTITANPPLELTAAQFCLNRSGTYAAVAGSALEDPEISRVVVVDLTNCRPAPTSTSAAAAAGAAAPTPAAGRRDVCEAVVLDAELLASRPGLQVLQIAWHPDSDAHLGVLTSGECRARAWHARIHLWPPGAGHQCSIPYQLVACRGGIITVYQWHAGRPAGEAEAQSTLQ